MINIFKSKLAFVSLLFPLVVLGNDAKLAEEKELELVNFNSIKKVLQEDGLSQRAINKKKEVEKLKVEKARINAQRNLTPSEEDMWGFLTEYYLVKNAQVLNWDFNKPEYGIDTNFKDLLEKLGFYQKKFKVLVLNTPEVYRGILPGSNGEDVFLISLPFIRSLDLSKLEISMLLLEDFFRSQTGLIKRRIKSKNFNEITGSQINKTNNQNFLKDMLKSYDESLKKGFSFQEQFEMTKKMDSYLKAHPELWNTYFKLLGKIDNFTKGNNLYKKYIEQYPSPQMQIKWLSPEKKVL